MWDKFSSEEMGRRWKLARELMDAQDVRGLLVFGDSGVNRHNQANVFWLTNHLDLHHNYLVAPRDESIEPALYVGLRSHVPSARQVSDVALIEWGGYAPARTAAERLKATGIMSGRLGIVGIDARFGIGMPYHHEQEIRRELPNLDLIELTAEFSRLRELKSEEEITWLERAAALTDRSIDALRYKIRVGLPEYALLGIIEGAYRVDGGIPHIAFLRSMPMDAPSGCVPAQNPSSRPIEKGDVIITKISASYWGYSGQIHRPFFIGVDPSPEWQAMFETAAQAYHNMCRIIRPGANEADVIREASIIGERGYKIYDDLIHGYGVDIHPPIIDRTCCDYWPIDESRPIPEGRPFESSMAIVVQPNPITPDERMGLQVGALTIVTGGGAQSLHEVPLEPIVVEV
jgi:Xaa-Pro aminopeptidase